MRRKFRIQPMDSLHNEETAFVHLEEVILKVPFSGDEIIKRQFHFVTIHQGNQMLLEKLEIERI